ncbi:MAG: hypothetical protein DCC53_13120 [Chloroflexi bacterium]|nr:2-iminobutanoate/2-iminopropanoate deaminase [Anaerolineae bacterium]RIK19578.1 MAG: hypothetical protein DCC53_13120 [Chloroflexota bacterium]
MPRQNISSGSPYEPILGLSRAVRVGPLIVIAGTAPIGPDRKTVAPGDVEAQARRCYEIAKAALEQAGASLDHVIRTRTMLTRIEDWQVVGKVRSQYVGHVRPVDTVVQVSRFIDPEWLIEIEVDAYVDDVPPIVG